MVYVTTNFFHLILINSDLFSMYFIFWKNWTIFSYPFLLFFFKKHSTVSKNDHLCNLFFRYQRLDPSTLNLLHLPVFLAATLVSFSSALSIAFVVLESNLQWNNDAHQIHFFIKKFVTMLQNTQKEHNNRFPFNFMAPYFSSLYYYYKNGNFTAVVTSYE